MPIVFSGTQRRMLHAYNRWAEKRLQDTQKEINYVILAKRHESLILQKKKLLATRTRKIQEWRKELTDLLKAKDMEAAKSLYKIYTDEDFVEVHPVYKPKHSPRSTLRQKMQKRVIEKGGPIHPNLLPRTKTQKRGKRKRA